MSWRVTNGTELDKILEQWRKQKESKGWISSIAALDHGLYYDKDSERSELRDIYVSGLEVGEEIYITEDKKNVFVDKSSPNVAHILVVSKTTKEIQPKWLSLSIFRKPVLEYEKNDNDDIMNSKQYKNKEEYQKHLSETFSDEEMIKRHLDSYTEDFCIVGHWPATNHPRDVFKALEGCDTNLKIWEKIKGKAIKVVKITPVYTYEPNPVYTYPHGYKHNITINVPAFVFIDKKFDKDVREEHNYGPEYLFGDYRIIVNTKTEKYGIKSLKTGKEVVPCVYDRISHHKFCNDKYSKDQITIVHFKKNAGEAMCREQDLETLFKK